MVVRERRCASVCGRAEAEVLIGEGWVLSIGGAWVAAVLGRLTNPDLPERSGGTLDAFAATTWTGAGADRPSNSLPGAGRPVVRGRQDHVRRSESNRVSIMKNTPLKLRFAGVFLMINWG